MKQENLTINVTRILNALWRFAVPIVLCTALCAGGMYFYSAHVKVKEYVASVSIIVDNRDTVESGEQDASQKKTNTDITASRYMVDEYIAILKNSSLLSRVAELVNVNNEAILAGSHAKVSYGQLGSMLSMSAVNSTAVLQIKAKTDDPQLSVDICRSIVEVAKTELLRTMNVRSVNSIEEDNILLPKSPVSPNTGRDTMLGAVIGFVFSAAIVAAVQILDNTVKANDDPSALCGLTVIGEIPSFDGKNEEKRDRTKRRKLR